MQIVTTKYGKIKGIEKAGYTIFKGIPYAKPPIGELRWHAPIEPSCWEGELTADHFSPAPLQPRFPWDEELQTMSMSENCLYLNIWTPAESENEKLPVVIWVYGGAYQSGTAGLSMYDGKRFAENGCVFVSFNYRVGPFGFFADESLVSEDEEGLTGSYGTMDQAVAIRWVHENIAAFGGDPENVTLFGQSAGAHSVMTMCASPRTNGMISRAIIHSTGGLSPLYYQDEHTIESACADGKRQLEKLGVSTVEEARKLDAETVLKKLMGEHWFPTTGGSLLPEGTISTLMHGKEHKIDYLIGFNAAEAGSMAGFWKDTNAEKIAGFARKSFPKDTEGYLKTVDLSTQEKMHDAAFRQYGDDKICAALAWRALKKNRGEEMPYQYFFTLPVLDREGNRVQPYHSAELPYVFGTLDARADETDLMVSEIMGKYWLNFIKTGDPNGNNLPYWDRGERFNQAMEIGLKTEFKDVPIDKTAEFIVDYMLKRSKE